MFRGILEKLAIVLLGVALFQATAHAAPTKFPLSDVLCSYLVNHSENSVKDDVEWKDLVTRMEKRTPDEQVTALFEKPAFRECVARYKHDMEVGQFILEGKEALDETLSAQLAEKSSNPPLMSVTFSIEDRQLSTPEFAVTSEEVDSSSEKEIQIERLRHRIDHYKSLWDSFLDVLRKRLTDSSVKPA